MEDQGQVSTVAKIWIAAVVLILVVLNWLPFTISEMAKEEPPPFSIAFYDPALEDAFALSKLVLGNDHTMFRKAGEVGPRGAPFRQQVKLYYQELTAAEVSLASHFANRQTEDDIYLENRLQEEFEALRTAASSYHTMLDAILALDTLEEDAFKKGDRHPLEEYSHYNLSSDYQRNIGTLLETLLNEKMNRIAKQFS